MKIFFFFFFSSLVGAPAEESVPALSSVDPEGYSAYFEDAEDRAERYFGRALFQATTSNLVVWLFDLTVLQAPYARISLQSWEKNLREGFEWDNSDFFTNQVLHPYQGALYFNAARLNGHSFWEAIPFTFYGSLMWEYFMERDYPSVNDLITTSFGGVALGEGGYRLALAFIDERATGHKKVVREIAALIANPVLAFNRLLYGEEVLRRNRLPRPLLDLTLYSGLNRTRDDFPLFGVTPHPFLGFLLKYGDPYDSRDVYRPYDFFSLHFGADIDVDNPGWDIFAHAVLYGKKLYPGDRARGVFGFYQHFDYLENFVYKFAANGVGVGTQFLFPFFEDMSIEALLHLYGIALGGVDSQYSRGISGRDYSLGPGGGLKSGLRYSAGSLFGFSLFFHQYWFYTSSGSDTQNTVGILSASGEAAVKPDLLIGVEFHLYERWSDAGVDNSSTYGMRTYLAYRL